MALFLPERFVTRQRLLTSSLIVLVVSMMSLLSLTLGPFGSPWPIAILWAICGWAGLGPNSATSLLMLVLGLWVDVLSGTHLGTWAFVALGSFVLSLLAQNFFGLGNLRPLVKCAVCGVIMMIVMIGFELAQHQRLVILDAILPVLTATILYPLVDKWFDLSEDDI
jgi:hypothetical protein